METIESHLASYAWPVSRLGELIENLARKARLIARPEKLPRPPDGLLHSDDETIGRWIDVAAGHLGLEAESVDTLYADTEVFIRAGGPAILRLPGPLDDDRPRLIALIKGGTRRAKILGPDLKVRRLSAETLRGALCFPLESAISSNIENFLAAAEVPAARLVRARQAILREQLGPLRIHSGWLLRYSPGASLLSQFRHGGVYRPVFTMFGFFFIQQVLAIASWFVIGRGVFQGHFDLGWLFAWAILLFTAIPLQMIINDAQGELSMNAGTIFKERLLFGTLKLEPEDIRHLGMGQFLSRVMESEAVEMLALNGGFLAILSLIELVFAGIILALGAGGLSQAFLLAVWVAVALFILWRYYQISRDWSQAYREMTNDLTEEMVGHRTRLAQEDQRYWHEAEDQALDRYLKLSESMDRIGIQLNSLVIRGWLLIGLAGVAYPFILNSASPQALAISLGGVLLATQALSKLVSGAQSLVSLFIAWRQVGPLFNAAARPRDHQSLDFVSQQKMEPPRWDFTEHPLNVEAEVQPLLVVRDLIFRYRPQGKPVIQECTLEINPGDRLLLEGPSGGGKSTLAALLTGLRQPEAGSMLLWGYDRQIIGSEEWRRRVVMAPQFQENHVFSETLGFNLLMGRHWPPEVQDLQEAEAVCQELGLGEVLSRMPSGFQQMLGESGWQLSHGERSRLFIARALLQNADLVILDESFGALDPENLYRAMRCVLERAQTVLVIAHP